MHGTGLTSSSRYVTAISKGVSPVSGHTSSRPAPSASSRCRKKQFLQRFKSAAAQLRRGPGRQATCEGQRQCCVQCRVCACCTTHEELRCTRLHASPQKQLATRQHSAHPPGVALALHSVANQHLMRQRGVRRRCQGCRGVLGPGFWLATDRPVGQRLRPVAQQRPANDCVALVSSNLQRSCPVSPAAPATAAAARSITHACIERCHRRLISQSRLTESAFVLL